MSRTEWAINQIRRDHNAAVTEAASAGRSVSAVLDEHAKMRSR